MQRFWVQITMFIYTFLGTSNSDFLPNNPLHANSHQHPAMNIGLTEFLLQRRKVCALCLLNSLFQNSLHSVAFLELLHEGNIEGQAKDVIMLTSPCSKWEISRSFSQLSSIFLPSLVFANSNACTRTFLRERQKYYFIEDET